MDCTLYAEEGNTAEKHRLWVQRKRQERTAAGLCHGCGKPKEPNHKQCNACLQRRRDNGALLRAQRKRPRKATGRGSAMRDIPGQCIRCTNPPSPGDDMCAGCIKTAAEIVGWEPIIDEE